MSFVVKTADLTKVKSLSLALLSPHLSYTQTGKRGVTVAPVAPLLMVAPKVSLETKRWGGNGRGLNYF